MNEAQKELIVSDEILPADQDAPRNVPEEPERPIEANRKHEFAKHKTDIVSNIESSQGTEVIIYQTPQELPESSNFHIVVYIFVQMGSDILAKLIISALIISVYSGAASSFAPLALFFVIYYIWKIAFNIFYYIAYGARVPEFKSAYVLDIILAIGYIVIFWAAYLYFKGTLAPTSLPLYVIPLIILTLIRLCVGEAMHTPYLPGSFFAFFESLQILYIALKLSNPSGHSDWTWILLFFYIVTIFFLVIAFILMIVLIIFVLMVIFQTDLIREMPNLTILVICGFAFFIVWNGIAFYYFLSGFQFLADANQIGPKPPSGDMNQRLLYISWFVVICASITLILLLLIFCFLKDALLSYFNKTKAKEISLQSFAKDLNLDIKKVSGNYFKKNNPDEESPDKKMQHSNGEMAAEICIICIDKPSDVLIHRCGHSPVCESCLKEYIKDKDDCPMCRAKIDKAYLIFFDEKKKSFMARGVIKVKR
jgi:hypothetical protein